jgi:Ca2+-binding RTX toxin-like protein
MAMQIRVYNGTTQEIVGIGLLVPTRVIVTVNGAIWNSSEGSNQDLFLVNAPSCILTILGTAASADGTPIEVRPAATFGTTIEVGATGLLAGVIGIRFEAADGLVINAGRIDGQTAGIQTGLVGQPSGLEIENSGTIFVTSGIGIHHRAATGSSLTLTNSGQIRTEGGFASYRAEETGNASDRIENSGTMSGDVILGGGNDLYISIGAGAVEGAIFGGLGQDSFGAGAAREVIYGGADFDSLSFFNAPSGVVMALDGSHVNTGYARGDVYDSIQLFTGTNFNDAFFGNSGVNWFFGASGNDALYGNAGNDRLEGNSGDDRLYGGTQNDLLYGGSGDDTMFGGTGNDSFVFERLADIGDKIGDFSSAASGNNDSIRIDASEFGGGLVAGALSASRFVVAANNLAQDSADRFIFRTTDRTLWFDRDGTGAAGPVMVADLQTGATMTSTDISLF